MDVCRGTGCPFGLVSGLILNSYGMVLLHRYVPKYDTSGTHESCFNVFSITNPNKRVTLALYAVFK